MAVDFDNIRADIEKKKYRLIGSGSGRLVYDLDNGYVIKVVKNRRGLAQNKAEYRIAASDHSHIFAKVTAVSEDSYYLVMEKAEMMSSIAEVWKYYHVRNNRELFRLKKFREAIRKNNLLLADLGRLNSWGKVRGKPVIIDFGFTSEVSRYYSPFGFRFNFNI
jgi:hypothetical protein